MPAQLPSDWTAQDETPATLRRLRPADVAATARLHIRYLGHGLFPRLGGCFLRRWHLTFTDNPYASGYVAQDPSGDVVAFLLGATDQRRYVATTLREDGRSLALLGLLGLLARPVLAWSFLRTRLRRYATRILRRRAPVTGPAAPIGVVHAIVTAEAARGHGIGRRLLSLFETDVRERGVSTIELVTEEDGGAVPFYRRLGWTECGTRANRDGRQMVHFSKTVGT